VTPNEDEFRKSARKNTDTVLKNHNLQICM